MLLHLQNNVGFIQLFVLRVSPRPQDASERIKVRVFICTIPKYSSTMKLNYPKCTHPP